MAQDYQGQLEDFLSTHYSVGEGEDDGDGIFVSGDDAEDNVLEGIMGARDEAAVVSRLASTRIGTTARLSPATRARLTALTSGAKLVRRIAEVNNARQALRPNSYCPITSGWFAA